LALRLDTLSFADQVDQFATGVTQQLMSQGNNHRVVKMAQVVRMLWTFQAILTLVRSELNDGAGAWLRCLLEQYFVFRAIEVDETMLQRATEEVEAEGHKAVKALLSMDRAARADDLTDAVLQEAPRGLQQGTVFNAFDWEVKTTCRTRVALFTAYSVRMPTGQSAF
jgi:hypothetical protein